MLPSATVTAAAKLHINVFIVGVIMCAAEILVKILVDIVNALLGSSNEEWKEKLCLFLRTFSV